MKHQRRRAERREERERTPKEEEEEKEVTTFIKKASAWPPQRTAQIHQMLRKMETTQSYDTMTKLIGFLSAQHGIVAILWQYY